MPAPADPASPHEPRVGLSSSSVYPDGCATAFATAQRLGYDGVEVMVWTDPVSQDAAAIRALSERHGLPVLAVHAPTLLVTQRVFGPDPWPKVDRSVELALAVGAPTVVVHPPFRWQKDYAEEFTDGVALREHDSGVRIAVENMYPWRAGRRELMAYLPGWDPVDQPYDHVTLDLSHTATAQSDALAQAAALGPRLAHVHLADGSGSTRDEHLVPGRGGQPCAELLERIAAPDSGFRGDVVVEVSTRKAGPAQREVDLAESLAFARLHLFAPPTT
ncbi:sugar phosphate isomerase/epimerase family protein [Lapillicoccus jejuensis]|uniref:Sugar phosphate isomerase/epimerase n=1 Tax=Lapillicoccus jejuensis TaxID=402171 RepID=A0A542DXC3_9MICO|nr:sugar phosphate isomerase/epimerase family protein [Lapillicoccus jejuensis]TQJ07726.1 sugar phosphate isomerase/epimerase [Lapillicoccus jejuensis]